MALTGNRPIDVGVAPGIAPEVDGAVRGQAHAGGVKEPAERTVKELPRVSGSEVGVSTDVETKGAEESKPVAVTDVDSAPASDATAGIDRKIRTYEDMMGRLDEIETPEKRRKRERREKSAKIISAVSDGLSALGNLYFTSQYAPNMYNHEKSSQLNAQHAAIERARKEREANRDAHLRLAIALGDAENERARTVREMEAQQERARLAREKARREEDAAAAERALDPFKQGKAKAEQDYWENRAATERAAADNAPEMQRAKLETEKAHAGSYQASAAASRASASAHSRSNAAEFSAWDEHGREHKFRTADAAEKYARQHGTWHEEEVEQTTKTHIKSRKHGDSDRTATTVKKGGYARKPFDVSKYKRGGSTPPPLN